MRFGYWYIFDEPDNRLQSKIHAFRDSERIAVTTLCGRTTNGEGVIPSSKAVVNCMRCKKALAAQERVGVDTKGIAEEARRLADAMAIDMSMSNAVYYHTAPKLLEKCADMIEKLGRVRGRRR